MRIKIINSNPKGSEKHIDHLIGREFDVLDEDETGKYIGYGETGLYFINEDEYEIVEE